MSALPDWTHNEPFEATPRFYDARPCPQCGRTNTTTPKRNAPPGDPQAIRVQCFLCKHEGEPRPTWRDALRAFYGDLPGRSPPFGPQVGQRFQLRAIEPPVYPLPKGFNVGDVVTMIDFETGSYTVRRDSDGAVTEIQQQNIGDPVK